MFIRRRVTGFYKYKKYGRYITGAPYTFIYDMEYKEENPNIAVGLVINPGFKNILAELECIEEVRAVKLIHKGTYNSIGSTYYTLFEYCSNCGYEIKLPIIEHYIKGPGLIFRGKPENYLTECIILLK